MYHLLYSIENAIKNLVRTKELLFTILIIFLISSFTFTSYYLFSLINSWKNMLMNEDNFITLIPVNIFHFLIAIIFFTSFLFLIFYTRNAFRSFFFMQKDDIRTMSFIGLPFSILSFEFAIQPVICLSILLPLSAVVGKIIVNQFISDFMSTLELNLTQLNDLFFIILLIFFSCVVIFFSTFFFIRRMIEQV
ncbi:hypothetical protein BCR24_00140 [Enterococcus ureilyticus]|uniref:ABC3 transporter permease protein domain-containing protein n=1 Tax=Enterococcus ureilyticus TaxID=1131292 RepID=A0A1E5HFW5_9ENTE|nr:hypothetical protein [Enterococcus ureilyticus]MBM7688133.1 nitrogen fixation-related uncharacterized protein [Enterococcus ureilyticus]OEG23803.1 hypothetical protein BCR24_00140 [Enterococcus ureilyticus]